MNKILNELIEWMKHSPYVLLSCSNAPVTSWRILEVGHWPSRDTFPILGIQVQIPSHQEVPFWQEVEQICLQIKPGAPRQVPE